MHEIDFFFFFCMHSCVLGRFSSYSLFHTAACTCSPTGLGRHLGLLLISFNIHYISIWDGLRVIISHPSPVLGDSLLKTLAQIFFPFSKYKQNINDHLWYFLFISSSDLFWKMFFFCLPLWHMMAQVFMTSSPPSLRCADARLRLAPSSAEQMPAFRRSELLLVWGEKKEALWKWAEAKKKKNKGHLKPKNSIHCLSVNAIYIFGCVPGCWGGFWRRL